MRFLRNCLICGVEFSTNYSKKVYCGSTECEAERCRIKNLRAEGRRRGTRTVEKRRYKVIVRARNPPVKTHKHTIDYIRSVLNEAEYTLKSSKYLNNKQFLDVVCPEGHEWSVAFHNFKAGLRCKRCREKEVSYSVNDVRGLLEAEGYVLLNKPTAAVIKHRDIIEYRCSAGHERSCKWGTFLGGFRCRECFSDSLKHTFGYVLRRFSENGYTVVSAQYVNSHTPLRVVCPEGHMSLMSYGNYNAGYRCQVCSGNQRATPFGVVKDEFDKRGYSLVSSCYCPGIKLKYICPKGHHGDVSWPDFHHKGCGCPRCFSRTSAAERELRTFVEALVGPSEVVTNSRKIIPPYELDIFVPGHKVAIEYSGFYWHGEVSSGKSKDYHYQKLNLCNQQGIRLITIFEDEFLDRPEAVKSLIRSALRKNAVIVRSRSTTFGRVDLGLALRFLSRNHISGSVAAPYNFGLFSPTGELLQLVSFVPGRNKRIISMVRLVSLSNYVVVGGVSKLLSNSMPLLKGGGFTRLEAPCDLRYSTATPVFEFLGFKFLYQTEPQPIPFIKQRRVDPEYVSLNVDRVFDCGSRVYALDIS